MCSGSRRPVHRAALEAVEPADAIRSAGLVRRRITESRAFPAQRRPGVPDGVGRFNHFQAGAVYWTPPTGAHEVRGAIRDLWASLGWERSALGYPVTDETGTPDGVGRFNGFQGGAVYWTPRTGAHEVHGAILS